MAHIGSGTYGGKVPLMHESSFLRRSVFSKMASLVYFEMNTRNFENRPGENLGPLSF